MSRIWETHTVVAKSLQTLLDVGIGRVGPQQDLFLKPSLLSGSKAATCLPTCLLAYV